MAVNIDKSISWFKSMSGTRYSMNGSRNGSDGTGDCSGMVVTALYKGGASKPAWLYNTDSMHEWLIANGFELIAFNKSWNMQKGDVIILGLKGQSTGAAGHTALAVDGTNIIDCAWYGSSSVNAVRVRNENQLPYSMGFYVYRLKKGNVTTTPIPTPSKNVTWYSEKGTFTITINEPINIRDKAVDGKIIGTLKKGDRVKYDQFTHKDGYVWIRQPRANGTYGFIATGRSNGVKRLDYWGTFS